MKNSPPIPHSSSVLRTLNMALPRDRAAPERAAVEDLFRAHADFVWRTLHRMGVEPADLPDLLQEVFVVVHRKVGMFDPRSRATTWLFAIAARVASNHRRAARHRIETLVAELPERRSKDDPETITQQKRTKDKLLEALSVLSPAQRAVLVMFEVEGMSGDEIARELGIPVGTVHSRLHHAKRRVLAEFGESEVVR
jgi:RNA polymerase sigma-70 factor (ECF subfamily)